MSRELYLPWRKTPHYRSADRFSIITAAETWVLTDLTEDQADLVLEAVSARNPVSEAPVVEPDRQRKLTDGAVTSGFVAYGEGFVCSVDLAAEAAFVLNTTEAAFNESLYESDVMDSLCGFLKGRLTVEGLLNDYQCLKEDYEEDRNRHRRRRLRESLCSAARQSGTLYEQNVSIPILDDIRSGKKQSGVFSDDSALKAGSLLKLTAPGEEEVVLARCTYITSDALRTGFVIANFALVPDSEWDVAESDT